MITYFNITNIIDKSFKDSILWSNYNINIIYDTVIKIWIGFQGGIGAPLESTGAGKPPKFLYV